MAIFTPKGTIKTLVMTAVNDRIAKAEDTHKAKCEEIDTEAKSKKEAHAMELVNNILTGK